MSNSTMLIYQVYCVLRIAYSAVRIAYCVFRIPYSVLRIPQYVLRIAYCGLRIPQVCMVCIPYGLDGWTAFPY